MVATLYCGENEFDECRESILRQSYSNFEHVVIKDLPNAAAHDALYRGFVERAAEFELLIKVDADMVIVRDDLFECAVRIFQNEPHLDLLAIAVHDFFTNALIPSLNVYRNTLKWKGGDALFADGVAVPANRRRMDWHVLAPAAFHCKNPSGLQAFHFGVHKGLKVRTLQNIIRIRFFGKSRGLQSYGSLEDHNKNIHRTWKHFLRTRDPRLGLASLGAEKALAGEFDTDDLNYGNPRLDEVLRNASSGFSVDELEVQLKNLRRRNWGWLPPSFRMEAMRGDLRMAFIRCIVPSVVLRTFGRFFMRMR